MGRKTYEEVLGFGVEWPYNNCKSYIVSLKDIKISTDNTSLMRDIEMDVKALKEKKGDKDIWLVGGGKLISAFLDLELIDEMIITIIPIILGNGIRLFPDNPLETKFELKSCIKFDAGIVNLTYTRKLS